MITTADLDVWPEGGHAFINMATPLGELALDRTAAWLCTILDAAEPATARAVSAQWTAPATDAEVP